MQFKLCTNINYFVRFFDFQHQQNNSLITLKIITHIFRYAMHDIAVRNEPGGRNIKF